MTDRLTSAAAWLTSKLKTHASVSAVLRRPNGTTYNLTPTRGQSIFESVESDTGATVRVESLDWIVDLAELTTGGSTYLPQAGDVIELGNKRYAVFAPDGDHSQRYSSPEESSIRVHTRRLKDAS